MRRTVLLLWACLMAPLLAGCAHLSYQNYSFEEMETVFEGRLDHGDRVTHQSGDGLIELRGDELHMRDGDFPNKEPDDYRGDPWLFIEEEVGRNSLVSFELMLGPEQPQVQVNLFVNEGGSQRMSFVFWDTAIHYFVDIAHSPAGVADFTRNGGLRAGRWHRIDILLTRDDAMLFVNGGRRSAYPIPRALQSGIVGLECHGDATFRDLSIRSFTGYEVAR